MGFRGMKVCRNIQGLGGYGPSGKKPEVVQPGAQVLCLAFQPT